MFEQSIYDSRFLPERTALQRRPNSFKKQIGPFLLDFIEGGDLLARDFCSRVAFNALQPINLAAGDQ